MHLHMGERFGGNARPRPCIPKIKRDTGHGTIFARFDWDSLILALTLPKSNAIHFYLHCCQYTLSDTEQDEEVCMCSICEINCESASDLRQSWVVRGGERRCQLDCTMYPSLINAASTAFAVTLCSK